MSEVKFQIVTNFRNHTVNRFLNWWADKTYHKHMVCRTPAFFRNNLLCGVRASVGRKIVGAAGIIPCLNLKQEEMYFEDQMVVEFCSNFVDSNYRGNGIARKMILERTDFALANNFLPIIVTREFHIVKIISDLEWKEMPKFRKFDAIRREIRDCQCEKEDHSFLGTRCEVCPLLGRSIWFKENH